jgi:ubiquinone/menaquinone biosynthesis C-methylase UbiE
MYNETFQMLMTRQATYWWHCARRKMSVDMLRRYGITAGCRWLELGCGPGGNLAMMDAHHPQLVVGVDISAVALTMARSQFPNSRLVSADFNVGLPFSDESFDLVTIFHVIYHDWIDDEVKVLTEVARVLGPGGIVLITEPAFPVLAREMDKIQMVRRRYRTDDMEEMCRAAGLKVVFQSYFTSFGFPIILAMKFLRRIAAYLHLPQSKLTLDMKPLPRLLNETLHFVAAAEAFFIVRGWCVPLGVDLVCVAQRQD